MKHTIRGNEFHSYIDAVQDEVFILGMMYCEEYGVDLNEFKDNMYNDKGKMLSCFSRNVSPVKCAGLLFSLHVHPVIY